MASGLRREVGADEPIDLASSSSDSGDSSPLISNPAKRRRLLPSGFLDPLSPPSTAEVTKLPFPSGVKQFWKAGDYDGGGSVAPAALQRHRGGLDHVRVHPKFLHSNATSHKWALGALAELLDNSFDEVSNGATYVKIDMLVNSKDGTKMLLIEDDGGGMDPDKLRQCMSLGYSAKSKMAKTIGQYGNGFKTSTMRLGADVIVFSRSGGRDGKRATQSIGLLSYTFLRSTSMEDIVVPMLDYEKVQVWKRLSRTALVDWNTNLDTILKWSPYSNEAELLEQFSSIKDQGTRVIIYNLWEDDQGQLELDFDTDDHDIQIRGVNRDEKNILMATQFPNSKHFLTYRHSLRSYASILYLRLPHTFRMILRGREIEHHNIVNDMMLKQEVTYRPHTVEGIYKDPNMVAVVTIGFVKDAKHHIDVQGFNVYHKNRLIKPFWRVWTAAGSGGRGVIGVLEANFIEPAHDKQDFERTTILSRLEARLVQMQKNYWSSNSHRIGYLGSRTNKIAEEDSRGGSPEENPQSLSKSTNMGKSSSSYRSRRPGMSALKISKADAINGGKYPSSKASKVSRSELTSTVGLDEASDEKDPDFVGTPGKKGSMLNQNVLPTQKNSQRVGSSPATLGKVAERFDVTDGAVGVERMGTRSSSLKESSLISNEDKCLNVSWSSMQVLKDENSHLKERITSLEEELSQERAQKEILSKELKKVEEQLQTANQEQEALIDIFSEERNRRNKEEESLRKKLKDASATIQELTDRLKLRGK